MIQKLKRVFLASIMSVLISVPAVVAIPVAVGTAGATCSGGIAGNINSAANNASGSQGSQGCSSNLGSLSGSTGTLSNLAKDVVNIFSIVIGAASIIMILFGGFRYITSGGASDKVGNAKNTIIYAIIGLVIVAIAQVLVHFVLSSSTSAANTL